MKITSRKLRRMIREQVENITGEELHGIFTDPLKVPDDSPAHENILDEERPEDVEPEEDAWSGGANLVHPVDHEDAGGSDLSTDRGIAVMRVTESQLRRIIRKTLLGEGQQDVGKPMTVDYVYNSLMGKQEFGPRQGLTRMAMAMDALAAGDLRDAANRVMDALWIDDPPPGASEELEDLLAGVQTEDELADIGAEWGTRHFR